MADQQPEASTVELTGTSVNELNLLCAQLGLPPEKALQRALCVAAMLARMVADGGHVSMQSGDGVVYDLRDLVAKKG